MRNSSGKIDKKQYDFILILASRKISEDVSEKKGIAKIEAKDGLIGFFHLIHEMFLIQQNSYGWIS